MSARNRKHATRGSLSGELEAGLMRAAGALGQVVVSPLRLVGTLPGLGRRGQKPGSSPGIEQSAADAAPPDPASVRITLMEYGPDHLQEQPLALEALAETLAEPPAEPVRTRWVNIDGLSPYLIAQFKTLYQLHTLAAEDVLHVPQRPKAETYGKQLFVVTRMIHLREGELDSEQVSFFLLPDRTLLSFQEKPGDVWDPVRQRIKAGIPRIRGGGPDYLLYALLDTQVDHGFPLLERYGDALEQLEMELMETAHPDHLTRLHRIKRELALLRRIIWPTRDLMGSLYRDEEGHMQPETRTFLRDVYDHNMQLLDVIETYREIATGLNDLYMSQVGQRMNEIMKTLTIMASIFIPITFIAGVYGMNFEHMPELKAPWAYPLVWGVFIGTALGLLAWFRRKGWF